MQLDYSKPGAFPRLILRVIKASTCLRDLTQLDGLVELSLFDMNYPKTVCNGSRPPRYWRTGSIN